MARTRRLAGIAVTTTARERLEDALDRDGTGFEFVQVMRLLMRLYPERAAVGGWDDPAREVVRITVPPSLAFPPSEIASIAIPERDPHTQSVVAPAQLAVRFLGLTGPQGVLPHLYTQHAAERTRARDTAFRDFLDLFHHRAISLFYSAWERHHSAVAAERGAEDRLRSHLLDVAGLGTPAVQRASAIPVASLAFYAGLLALRARPAVGMAQLISDYFGVPAQIEQFVGAWQTLPHGGQQCIGADDDDGRLGAGVIGNAIYDPMSRVRLRLGPLTRAQFDGFLPGGPAHEPLRHLARLYADDHVGVEAQLVLAHDHVPGTMLGAPDTPALGFGSWLRTKPAVRDADDVQLTLC